MPCGASLGLCLQFYKFSLFRLQERTVRLASQRTLCLFTSFLSTSRAISLWTSEQTRPTHNLRWRNSFQPIYSHFCPQEMCGPVFKEKSHHSHLGLYQLFVELFSQSEIINIQFKYSNCVQIVYFFGMFYWSGCSWVDGIKEKWINRKTH